MNSDSKAVIEEAGPILLIPYMWIGDFVRCHSVVRVLRERWPDRPVDVLSTTLCAPLTDYMPGVRKAVVVDLPRRRLAIGLQFELARRLRHERYGTALVMSRTWKSALAPYLAGIPERIGFFGEGRFVLINDIRWGERALPRMVDQCGALALPAGAPLRPEWPLPELVVPKAEAEAWRARRGLTADARPIVTMSPGAVGKGKKWPAAHYAALARALTAEGADVWVLGGPNETPLAAEIAAAGGPRVHDLTGNDLRDAVIALTFADAAVTNDSGLMHISAALGAPTIGIFGPTSPRHWAPLNPVAAILEAPGRHPGPERGRYDLDNIRHRRTDDIPPEKTLEAVRRVLSERR